MTVLPLFDHNHVLPPHLGDPSTREHLSPYQCNIVDFVKRFSNTAHRIELLKKYLEFRNRMNCLNITGGFQWIDGSFTENIEASQKRPPNDIDIVTFYGGLSIEEQDGINTDFAEFFDPVLSKSNFSLDHYAVDIAFSPISTVENTRYWLQLFTHNRSGVWKGIVQIPNYSPDLDLEASEYLKNITT
jgi:hypothetical protein